jgi:MFS superfamily sulfate permease-like transporter
MVCISGLILAMVASVETLLTAAIDTMQNHASCTNYTQGPIGQGTAQILAGLLGLLPVSGVIARSSANGLAGAHPRLSTILHGVWAILFVVAFSNLLKLIPQPTTSAVLIYIALRIIKFRYFRHLW